MLDWLIIGGGIHGTHLALVLTRRAGVAPERLRILDPHPTLLARWHACTANTGMTFLRSGAVHHLDLHPEALARFAKAPDGQPYRPKPNIRVTRGNAVKIWLKRNSSLYQLGYTTHFAPAVSASRTCTSSSSA